MAGSQSLIGGGAIAGLSLRAWALVNSSGVILKAFNVSSVTKGTAGLYTINYAAAIADTNVLAELRPSLLASFASSVQSNTTAAFGYYMNIGGVGTDLAHYVAIWG